MVFGLPFYTTKEKTSWGLAVPRSAKIELAFSLTGGGFQFDPRFCQSLLGFIDQLDYSPAPTCQLAKQNSKLT